MRFFPQFARLRYLLLAHIHSGTCSWYKKSTSTSATGVFILLGVNSVEIENNMMHLPNSTISNYYTLNCLHVKICLRSGELDCMTVDTMLASDERQCLPSMHNRPKTFAARQWASCITETRRRGRSTRRLTDLLPKRKRLKTRGLS